MGDDFWGYWQAPVAEAVRDETIFTSRMGTLCFNRIRFELLNESTKSNGHSISFSRSPIENLLGVH